MTRIDVPASGRRKWRRPSRLVRGFLQRLVREPARGSGEQGVAAETSLERRRRLLEEVTADFDARGVGLRMADNLSREELYDRRRARAEAAEAAGKHRGSAEPDGSGRVRGKLRRSTPCVPVP